MASATTRVSHVHAVENLDTSRTPFIPASAGHRSADPRFARDREQASCRAVVSSSRHQRTGRADDKSSDSAVATYAQSASMQTTTNRIVIRLSPHLLCIVCEAVSSSVPSCRILPVCGSSGITHRLNRTCRRNALPSSFHPRVSEPIPASIPGLANRYRLLSPEDRTVASDPMLETGNARHMLPMTIPELKKSVFDLMTGARNPFVGRRVIDILLNDNNNLGYKSVNRPDLNPGIRRTSGRRIRAWRVAHRPRAEGDLPPKARARLARPVGPYPYTLSAQQSSAARSPALPLPAPHRAAASGRPDRGRADDPEKPPQ